MYLTEGHLWLFCFTYSFYCPFGYYQEVVNFHSQAWVTEVQSLRGGDTLQDGTLHAGDRNSQWHPSELKEKGKMSKIGGLMIWSPAVLEDMQNRPFPGKQPTHPLPGRGQKSWCRGLEGQAGGGDSGFLTTDLVDASTQWLAIQVAVDQIIAFREPTIMTFYFFLSLQLSYNPG